MVPPAAAIAHAEFARQYSIFMGTPGAPGRASGLPSHQPKYIAGEVYSQAERDANAGSQCALDTANRMLKYLEEWDTCGLAADFWIVGVEHSLQVSCHTLLPLCLYSSCVSI